MFGLLKKKAPLEQENTSFVSSEPLKSGFEEFKSILSDWATIRFAVPCHAWSELRESKEWRDFQALLEKYQTEHIQKKHWKEE